LAQAVLERLLLLRVTAIATTHHAALKTWAFADDRVASAAMEFDEATLRPTYRVLAGAAGSSAGIEVAGKLGLDAGLVARARELHGGRGADAEIFMARLRALTASAEERDDALRRREEALASAREELIEKQRSEAARRRDEVKGALAAALSQFKELSRRELDGIRDAKERAKLERAHVRAEGRLRELAREKQEAIAPSSSGGAHAPFAIAPGAAVRILSLDREGEIVAVRGDRVDVRMGAATFTVDRRDLAAADGEAPPAVRAGKSTRLAALAAASRASRSDEPEEGLPAELHLLGRTVDEALPELDKFLDASARQGRTEVRVVHGHGTGRLRLAVRAHLAAHPQVAAHRPGGPGEGGDGATVVTLV
jgi:DNA mismatch repair protein MutS2